MRLIRAKLKNGHTHYINPEQIVSVYADEEDEKFFQVITTDMNDEQFFSVRRDSPLGDLIYHSIICEPHNAY